MCPTPEPPAEPRSKPSVVPTSEPSLVPSSKPSSDPTMEQSLVPSTLPSVSPMLEPSAEPSSKPSVVPTSEPSSVRLLHVFPPICANHTLLYHCCCLIGSSLPLPLPYSISVLPVPDWIISAPDSMDHCLSIIWLTTILNF